MCDQHRRRTHRDAELVRGARLQLVGGVEVLHLEVREVTRGPVPGQRDLARADLRRVELSYGPRVCQRSGMCGSLLVHQTNTSGSY